MPVTCNGCCEPTVRLRISMRMRVGGSSWCYRGIVFDEEEQAHYFMRSTTKTYVCHRPSGGGPSTLCLQRQEDQWIPGENQLQRAGDYKPCELLAVDGGAIEQEIADYSSTCPPPGTVPSSGCEIPDDSGLVYSEEEPPPSEDALYGKALEDLEESEPLVETEGDWANSAVSFDPDFPMGGPGLSGAGGEVDVTETGATIVNTEYKIDNDGLIPLRLLFDLVVYRLEDDEELSRTPMTVDIPGTGSSDWMNFAPDGPDGPDSVYSMVENSRYEAAF